MSARLLYTIPESAAIAPPPPPRPTPTADGYCYGGGHTLNNAQHGGPPHTPSDRLHTGRHACPAPRAPPHATRPARAAAAWRRRPALGSVSAARGVVPGNRVRRVGRRVRVVRLSSPVSRATGAGVRRGHWRGMAIKRATSSGVESRARRVTRAPFGSAERRSGSQGSQAPPGQLGPPMQLAARARTKRVATRRPPPKRKTQQRAGQRHAAPPTTLRRRRFKTAPIAGA